MIQRKSCKELSEKEKVSEESNESLLWNVPLKMTSWKRRKVKPEKRKKTRREKCEKKEWKKSEKRVVKERRIKERLENVLETQ